MGRAGAEDQQALWIAFRQVISKAEVCKPFDNTIEVIGTKSEVPIIAVDRGAFTERACRIEDEMDL